jgi:hypothetical protein
VLDLSAFPLVDPVDEPTTQTVARQSYHAKGTVLQVGEQLRTKIKEAGCEEMDGAMMTEAYGAASYKKDGFYFSLMVSPASEPDVTMVNLINHGNANFKALPVPAGAKQQYALPSMIAYLSPGSVADTASECKTLLLEKGWQSFGETTVSFYVKKNAVILQVMVSAAPAQDGKTMIQISSEQMSVDLPAPPYSGILQYSDSAGNMLFDSEKSQPELVEFFKTELGKTGWSATTENPFKVGFREHLIFRNPEKEYLEVDFQEVEGKTRTRLKYQTAKQFAESEKRVEDRLKSKQ